MAPYWCCRVNACMHFSSGFGDVNDGMGISVAAV